jgi:hypothetical protein
VFGRSAIAGLDSALVGDAVVSGARGDLVGRASFDSSLASEIVRLKPDLLGLVPDWCDVGGALLADAVFDQDLLGGFDRLGAFEDEHVGVVAVEGEFDKIAGLVADDLDQMFEVLDSRAVDPVDGSCVADVLSFADLM